MLRGMNIVDICRRRLYNEMMEIAESTLTKEGEKMYLSTCAYVTDA